MTVSKITPVTEVKVCRGIPISPAYRDSMTYANESAKFSYFSGKAKYTYTNAIPVRDNVFRIPVAADAIYDCNYLIYKNANFVDKWFYCFILSVSWVNVNCAEVVVKPDVITTWINDWTLNPSYIERMHVTDDVRGRYREPEPVQLGEKIRNFKIRTTNQDAGFAYDVYYVPPEGVERITDLGYIAACCNVRTYDSASIQSIKTDIIDPLIAVGLQDNLLAIQTVPMRFSNGAQYTEQIQLSNFLNNIDGYVPVNQKLFTYPYNSLVVQNGEGNTQEFMLEEFSTNTPRWRMWCATSLDISIIGTFLDYGLSGRQENLTPDRLLMARGFPRGYWSGIETMAYEANLTSGLANTIHSAFTLNIPGGVSSMLGFMQTLAAPPLAKGGELPSSTSSFTAFLGDYYFSQSSVNQSIARDIDTYFTRWGYQINKVATPLINGRQKFNYIKAIDIAVQGNIPADDMAEIKQIFNDGITFWHQERGFEVGSWSGAPNDNPVV